MTFPSIGSSIAKLWLSKGVKHPPRTRSLKRGVSSWVWTSSHDAYLCGKFYSEFSFTLIRDGPVGSAHDLCPGWVLKWQNLVWMTCVLAWHAPGLRRVLRSLMRAQREWGRGNAVGLTVSAHRIALRAGVAFCMLST
jgi:hypothetical protein